MPKMSALGVIGARALVSASVNILGSMSEMPVSVSWLESGTPVQVRRMYCGTSVVPLTTAAAMVCTVGQAESVTEARTSCGTAVLLVSGVTPRPEPPAEDLWIATCEVLTPAKLLQTNTRSFEPWMNSCSVPSGHRRATAARSDSSRAEAPYMKNCVIEPLNGGSTACAGPAMAASAAPTARASLDCWFICEFLPLNFVVGSGGQQAGLATTRHRGEPKQAGEQQPQRAGNRNRRYRGKLIADVAVFLKEPQAGVERVPKLQRGGVLAEATCAGGAVVPERNALAGFAC